MTEYEKDPRPDLFKDHPEWTTLLELAADRDAKRGGDNLHGVLHGLRCGGASLAKDEEFGFVIKPGEWGAKGYADFKAKWLRPRAEEIRRLFEVAAGKVKAGGLTLRLGEEANAKIKAVEARALDLGWSEQDLWAEEEWDDPRDGRRRESLCVALLSACEVWGGAELGEVTAESAEIILPPRGGESKGTSLRHYRISPASRPQKEAQAGEPVPKQNGEALSVGQG